MNRLPSLQPRRRPGKFLLLLAALLPVISAPAQFTTNNFFNWETAPVQPVALGPDGHTLAVCNLPDGRLEIFSVATGLPVPVGSVPVGIDPVAVRFRTATELWVVNYISDTINVIDLPSQRVVNTINTANEPSDVVFAGTPQRAYVSCGQPNLVQVFDPATLQVVTNLPIDGNRPRGLAVSPNGSKVYVAIFESGNASTIIGSGINVGFPRANPVDFPNAPSGGLNPPPNSGIVFNPPINPAITSAPPRVSLIVKKNSAGRWLDDNSGDWTEYIRGTNAALTGRVPGWDLPDHDLAVISTANHSITYAAGLMNICMALAVNPASGKIAVVGTDGLNEVRFEPVLNGIFLRVNLAQVDPLQLTNQLVDLNSHLTYTTPQISEIERDKSIGDPRAIVWNAAGTRGYVTGMGSDNLIVIDAQGNRAGLAPTINVGQGPTGMALDEARNRLYVYNRFDGSLTTVNTLTETVVRTNSLFDPTPVLIKAGRPHLYNTRRTSGLGQAACGSCHVDTRLDRLAWDLGSQVEGVKLLANINFTGGPPPTTNHFHPMKGPMVTMTLQDIIGHEPFHWRGDRDDIEEFNGTFTNLQGAASSLNVTQMHEFRSFLTTVRFAPNPLRQFDNTLATSVPLTGHFALGRGALTNGATLPSGNARTGQNLFRQTNSAVVNANCVFCHTLPTGLGTDRVFQGGQWTQVPLGSNFAHHIGMIQLERSLNLPFKVQQLRNLFDKTGMDLTRTNSRAGFGFSHDGSADSLVRFVQDGFSITNDQTTADLVAFLLSITGSDLISPAITDGNRSPGVPSLDTPAAVGRQLTVSNSASVALLDSFIALAQASTSRVDLVARGFKDGLPRGWFYNRTNAVFQSDRRTESNSPAALRTLAAVGAEQTYTVVPRGAGWRLGVDRDADGSLDRDELDFRSDPADPASFIVDTGIYFAAVNFSNTSPVISIYSFTGKVYHFEFKDQLTDPLWTGLPGDIPGTGGVISKTDDTIGTNQGRFYRVLVTP